MTVWERQKQRQNTDWWVSKEGKNEEQLLNEYRIFFWGDANVLELNRGDNCTFQIYQMLLVVYFKIIKFLCQFHFSNKIIIKVEKRQKHVLNLFTCLHVHYLHSKELSSFIWTIQIRLVTACSFWLSMICCTEHQNGLFNIIQVVLLTSPMVSHYTWNEIQSHTYCLHDLTFSYLQYHLVPFSLWPIPCS